MRTISTVFVLLLLLISAETMLGSRLQQNEEQQAEPTSPQGQNTSKAAVQSVTGCVVQSDHGYSLKTENDTYAIETDQDLSKYVNKQVRLTGVLESHSSVTRSTGSESGTPSPGFTKDFRLRVIGSVIGDCSQPSK